MTENNVIAFTPARERFDFSRLCKVFNGRVAPRQPAPAPHELPATYAQDLVRHSIAGQRELDAAGQKLAQILTGNAYNIVPRMQPKDMTRIFQKTSKHYQGDPALNCDTCAIIIPMWDADSVMNAVDMFGGRDNAQHVVTLDDGTELAVIEFENNLTRRNSVKGGLPNATAIVAFRMDDPDRPGATKIMVGEIQFVPGQGLEDLKQSHKAYKKMDAAKQAKHAIEETIRNGSGARHSLDALTAERAAAMRVMAQEGARRDFHNRMAAEKTFWLEDVQGYRAGMRDAASAPPARALTAG